MTLLTRMSWWCGGIFLALSLVLAGLSTRAGRARSVLEGQLTAPAPTPISTAPLPLDLQPAGQGGAGAPAQPAPVKVQGAPPAKKAPAR